MKDLQIGEKGEDESAKFLKLAGYKILERNYRTTLGEIDIIAKRNGRIHFCEVKTSIDVSRQEFFPEQRVGQRKQDKLKMLSEFYLSKKKLEPKNGWQIDILSVFLDKDGNLVHIYHIENAVWESQY